MILKIQTLRILIHTNLKTTTEVCYNCTSFRQNNKTKKMLKEQENLQKYLIFNIPSCLQRHFTSF